MVLDKEFFADSPGPFPHTIYKDLTAALEKIRSSDNTSDECKTNGGRTSYFHDLANSLTGFNQSPIKFCTGDFMRFFFVLMLVFGLSQGALARQGVSAVRFAHESYEMARDRHLFTKYFPIPLPQVDTITTTRTITAEKLKKPLKNLDLREIPDVGSYADLENEFKYIRDTRFIETENPQFPRRLTWLYPDDGCYARAELAKDELVNHNFAKPKKLFVFGNLTAASANSPTGSVQWWYHVAVSYRVGDDVFVLDPALQPARPLKLTEWNNLVGGTQTRVQYAICSAETFDPTVDCQKPTPMALEDAIAEQRTFLQDEWDRLLELKRNPEQELGNLPPWLQP